MTGPGVRVLHIDDDRDHHELVKAQLRRFSDGIALERADSRRAAMACLEQAVYDCILTDDRMPEEAGLGLLKELRRRGDLVPFVVLSGTGSEDGHPVRTDALPGDEFHALVDHFQFDLVGFWIRRLDDKYRELLRTNRLEAGIFRSDPRKIAALREAAGSLTARERQILEMIGAGRSNAEIADELFISYRTAKNHVSHIFAKLGMHTRAEAIHFVMAMKVTGG
jgi:DNA-binding NarL/FixJ family response regulator